MENRTQAMIWWNNLISLEKQQICGTNKELTGSIRRWETLTGREIEYLFKKIHQKNLVD